MAESNSDAPDVPDVPEPYLEMRSMRFEPEFVVDLDKVTPGETIRESRRESVRLADSGGADAYLAEKDDPTAPVVMTWKNLSVFVGKKQLLHNLKGKITAGFYAIMGPSGSGKTTLLNTLACRLDRMVRVS
jgi:ABC-type multidrug transport system fused ATPase/permease subunit